MILENIIDLYKRSRLLTYRQIFGAVRERDGSLSATEAYTVDVIYLLKNPTITQLADTLGISQPNATYKVNNLVSKGYVTKTTNEEDRRETRLGLAGKFYSYYNVQEPELDVAVNKLSEQFTAEELQTFDKVLSALNEHLK